ncbi:MAG: hypothetical protein HQ519_12620 [Planctomycetes bacterium]|nr:hypothetical protein [Planctomycetota bacterium]
MKPLTSLLALILLCLGCTRGASPSLASPFAKLHSPKEYFFDLRDRSQLESGGYSAGGSNNSEIVDRDFSISLKGDAALRDSILREYFDKVSDDLTKSGVGVRGKGRTGDLMAFDFDYESDGVRGKIWVNGIVDYQGFIQINVLTYEHEYY